MTDFEELHQRITEDEALASELLTHQDIATFSATIVRLAERYGLRVSEADVHQAVSAGRSAWYATWSP